MMGNRQKNILLVKVVLFGTISLCLYILLFSNQKYVTEYFTKANWYDWEEFIQSNKITYKEKVNILKKSILSQNDPKLTKKLNKLGQQNTGKEEFINLMHFTINLRSEEKLKIKKILNSVSPEKTIVLKKKTLLRSLGYALLPVLTVFLFSFIHAAFASHFWSLLGIEGVSTKRGR